MSVFSGSTARAKDSIAKKGALCTWRQFDVQPGSTDWKEDDAATFTDYPVRIALFPYSTKVASMGFQHMDGDVEQFSEYGIMSGDVPFTPRLRDLIIKPDNSEVKMMGYDPLSPDGLGVIIYTIGLVG